MGEGPNDSGSSRFALINACEASLRRLGTDYIDLYFMHGFDATSPVEETLSALDSLIRAGKIRYIGCSNFSGWHTDEVAVRVRAVRLGALRRASGVLLARLARVRVGADALALDQKVGTMVVECARRRSAQRQAAP